MQCKKCLRFNHPQPGCKQENPSCKNCSETTTTNANSNQNALTARATIHPWTENTQYFSRNRNSAIRITEKVDHKTARSIYFTRHNPIQETSYSQTVINPPPTENPTRPIEKQIHNKNEIHKKPTTLDDFLKEVDKKYEEISKIVRTPAVYDSFDEEMRSLTNDDSQKSSTSTNDRVLRSQKKKIKTI